MLGLSVTDLGISMTCDTEGQIILLHNDINTVYLLIYLISIY